MKKLVMFIVLILATTVSFAQLTPEQKKMIEEAKKKEAEAQKKVKEMMNTPEMKKMMEQLKKQDSLYALDRKKKQKVKKQTQQKKKTTADYYWLGKIESNTQGKFSNWSFGKADIKIRFSNGWNKPADYLKIGEISANGQVSISLPEIDINKWPRKPIVKGDGEGDDLFNDFNKTLDYSNKNATYFTSRFRLNVMQGDKDLGNLSVANSVITSGNLNAPCCSNKAGDGYIAYWIHMSDANTMKGKDNIQNKTIDTNLQFKKGWNIVLTRVEGNRTSNWTNKYHTATTTMPADAKYYFMSDLINNK